MAVGSGTVEAPSRSWTVRDGNGSSRAIIRPPAKRLRVEIYTRTRRVSGTRRVYHSTYKSHIRIISLMSKAQYTHVQN
jgi:hypothetical protein